MSDPSDEIPRSLPGPLPRGMNNRQFGQLIGWGTGDAEAEARVGSVEITALKTAGVTRAIIRAWAAGYRQELRRNPGNPSAGGRVALLDWLLRDWDRA
ncbi:MAG: DUF4951 domain-containing protein [Dehalococcoidia bacterium]